MVSRTGPAGGHSHRRTPPPPTLDPEPVLDLIDGDIRTLLDIGCGTGDLLERAASRFGQLDRIVGIDLSEEPAGATRTRLGDLPVASEIHEADIRRAFPPVGTFDCVTMTFSPHWLDPVETIVIHEISRHVGRNGVLVLSTHHPPSGEAVVSGALVRLGWSRERADAFSAGDEPAGRHNATTETRLKNLLSPYFDVRRVVERLTEIRVESAEQYRAHHRAVFGERYADRLAADERDAFLAALGEEAMARMERHGHVTALPTRIRRCVSTNDRRIDVV